MARLSQGQESGLAVPDSNGEMFPVKSNNEREMARSRAIQIDTAKTLRRIDISTERSARSADRQQRMPLAGRV